MTLTPVRFAGVVVAVALFPAASYVYARSVSAITAEAFADDTEIGAEVTD